MRASLINAVKKHAEGHIAKHIANIEVYLNNPVGIGEHNQIIEAIEEQLDMIAKYNDQIEMIDNYFVEDTLE
tara:strand:- start:5771 stop:5986 length:216 start_codon:yes stop_codon:yes gene_type:complete